MIRIIQAFVVGLCVLTTIPVALAADPAPTSGAGGSGVATSVGQTQSVNLNPIGFLLGSYTINYNRILQGGHSVLGEVGFSQSDDGNSSSTAGSLLAGYRWYWGGNFDSGFVGANIGYGMGTAETTVEDKSFDLSVRALTATVNVGKRWAWDGGFNITVRIGAGRAMYTIDSTSKDPEVQDAIDQVEKLFNALPIALDGELSAGYCF